MSTSTSSTNRISSTRRLRLSLKWAWAGPVGGLACMVALFVAGIATQTPGMVVMAASVAAVLGGVWAGVTASLRRGIAQVEQ
jgi:hypothetical protein